MKNQSFNVNGFLSAVTKARIKKGSDREDLGLIVSESPATAAGVFTRNQVKAASIVINQERIQTGLGRAILVNSGNANACTGERGLRDTRTLTGLVSRIIKAPEDQVFMASTGVIGQFLPLPRMKTAIPGLAAELAPGGLPALSRAIMTTDTFPKILSREVPLGSRTGRIVGLAKGAGMIQPDMATMLCFVLTDVAVKVELLNQLLSEAVDRSFNRITVDGDTSTNDLVLVLANGRAGNPLIRFQEKPRSPTFLPGPEPGPARIGPDDRPGRRRGHQTSRGGYQGRRERRSGPSHGLYRSQLPAGQNGPLWGGRQLGTDPGRPGSFGGPL